MRAQCCCEQITRVTHIAAPLRSSARRAASRRGVGWSRLRSHSPTRARGSSAAAHQRVILRVCVQVRRVMHTSSRVQHWTTQVIVLCALLACGCLAQSSSSYSIPLNRCAPYALLAGSAITADGERTTVHSGDVGITPSASITGNLIVENGDIERNTDGAKACASDHVAMWNTAMTIPCDAMMPNIDLGSRTFTPGVYCSDNMLRINEGSITLDGEGDTHAQWMDIPSFN
jgi:hypothetical protein